MSRGPLISVAFLFSILVHLPSGKAACGGCPPGNLGGPVDNRQTAFDVAQPGLLVNTTTLNLVVTAVDLAFDGPAAALSLERFYNSDDPRDGPFGNSWSFTLGETLTADTGKSWILRRGSGRTDRFAPSFQPGSFFAVTMTGDTLIRNPDMTFTLALARAGERAPIHTFSADGHLLATGEPGFKRVTLEYDSNGRVTVARSGSRFLQFSYDGGGHVISVADSAGRIVMFSYDDRGNLVQQTNADGRTVSYSYDGNGLLVAIGRTALTWTATDSAATLRSIALPDGTVRQYTNGRTGEELDVQDGAGNLTIYTSNALGLTESVTDGLGNRTAYAYDSAGRPARITTPSGEIFQFEYDGGGRVTSAVDPAGNRWRAEYAGSLFERPASVTDPKGNIYQFSYDANGNAVQVIDPQGGATVFTRNASGLITTVQDANGNKNNYQYDAGGLITQWTNALAAIWNYTYDGAARVAARTEPNGTMLQAEYDAGNRLTALTSGPDGLTLIPDSATRDDLNRITQYTDSYANVLTYSYNSIGKLAKLSFSSDKSIGYEYDAAGRLAKVSDWLGNFAIYKYDASGFITSLNFSSGPLGIYQYDAAHYLNAVVSTGPDGNVVAGYRYTNDANGNHVNVSALEPSTAPLPSQTAALAYDAANRLTSRGSVTYTYDASGKLTGVQGDRPVTFGYDSFGRLQTVAGAPTLQYKYDATGLRVERTAGSDTRRFVYDLSGPSPRVVIETDGQGNALAWYVYGAGLLWKNTASGASFFYHFDGNGNVVAVSQPAAGVVNRYRYDPFGKLVAANETVENWFHARGEAGWMDEGNGLLYGAGRFFYPDTGSELPGPVDLRPPYPAPMDVRIPALRRLNQ